MINLLRLQIGGVSGRYNYNKISEEDNAEIVRRSRVYKFQKFGKRPEFSPYLDTLTFNIGRSELSIFQPFFEVFNGFIASASVLGKLEELVLAPFVIFPVWVIRNGKRSEYFYLHFYSSVLENIDFQLSIFHWVVPNKHVIDKETGEVRPSIVRPAESISFEGLVHLYKAKDGQMLWYERLVIKQGLLDYDMFELDVIPPSVLVKPEAAAFLKEHFNDLTFNKTRIYVSE